MNRQKWDIWVEMLSVANGGAPKTRIMYKSNASPQDLKKHLSNLQRFHLLEQRGSLYYRTPRGKQFVEMVNKVNLLLEAQNV